MTMTRTFWFLSFALLLLVTSQSLYGAEAREAKRVLVLYSEDKENRSQEMADQGIRAGFRSNQLFNVQLYNEYLDVSRFGDPFHARATADFLRRKYSGMEIDVIITVYPYAVDFLLAEGGAPFPEVPVVAAVISRSYAENLEHSPARRFVTGTIAGDNIAGLMDAALRLRSKTKRIVLIAGTTANDIYQEQIYRRGFEPYAGRIDLIDLTKLSMEETLSRVASLPPDTLVFYSSIFRDGSGKTFAPSEVLSHIARVSTVPVFGIVETYLGFGIVGGRLVSFKEHGSEAAALALRVMGGESPASIPFGGEQAYVSAYDHRELERWNIPETTVPADAEIRYRRPSFWETYRWAIIGVIILVTAETLLILGLLINVRRRRTAEGSLRQRENELTTLTGRLIHTQEEELTRLSRDLHDDLTQQLAALAIDAGMLEKTLRPLQPQASQELADLKTGLIEVSNEVHTLSRQLHPSILDDLGFVQAIQSECDMFSKRTGIAVSFEPGDISDSIPRDVALCLYRVLQEGLQNIAKHSKSSKAQVVLQEPPAGVHLSIRDSGIGFDLKEVAGKGAIGLSSMRERVRLVNGTLTTVSEPGKGTEIQVCIPVGGTHIHAARADR